MLKEYLINNGAIGQENAIPAARICTNMSLNNVRRLSEMASRERSKELSLIHI